jgi:hypothetical protein
MIKKVVIKRVEEIAKYLAKNSSKTSIPVFSYKVKKPDGLEDYVQEMDKNYHA